MHSTSRSWHVTGVRAGPNTLGMDLKPTSSGGPNAGFGDAHWSRDGNRYQRPKRMVSLKNVNNAARIGEPKFKGAGLFDSGLCNVVATERVRKAKHQLSVRHVNGSVWYGRMDDSDLFDSARVILDHKGGSQTGCSAPANEVPDAELRCLEPQRFAVWDMVTGEHQGNMIGALRPQTLVECHGTIRRVSDDSNRRAIETQEFE